MLPLIVGALCCLSVVLVLAVVALAWWARWAAYAVSGLIKQVEEARGRIALVEQQPSLSDMHERLAKAEKRLQALSLERGLE